MSKIKKNCQHMSLPEQLPAKKNFVAGIRRAPDRGFSLNIAQTKTALKNALRYIPPSLHQEIAPEFLSELLSRGRIYGYRYRPEGSLKAKAIDAYPGKIIEARAFQVMIDNNLDFDVALYPYELVTYGESGQVFQNWMQYNLVKLYLQEMTERQTLVVYSGHPLGLFESSVNAPRVISTNGMLVGMYDNLAGFAQAAAMGVSNYGQMTAGGWMYIGPQGIVHGTYLTLLNAGRMYLGIPAQKDLTGVVYLSSGLGGMSGAQAKAIEIAGGIGVMAEVDESRIQTRYQQG
jgi:urocanate hydratase